MESLRPPEGYRVDGAIGTTFTLDLMALLVAPVAFSLFDWTDEQGRVAPDPLALLESIRRHGERLCVFHQAGYINLARHHSPLFTLLEQSILPVRSPHAEGLFHPKLWVLRFKPEDAQNLICYRVLCLSRNLTFDRSWDTVLVLEGHVQNQRDTLVDSRPLGDFVARLPHWVLPSHPVPSRVQDQIAQAQQELKRVHWKCPSGFEKLVFHPMVPPAKSNRAAAWPLRLAESRKMLVVSPFLDEQFPRHLEGHDDVTIVSRAETLDRIDPAVLATFKAIYTLRGDALPEEDDQPEVDAGASLETQGSPAATSLPDLSGDVPVPGESEVLSGLHAKLYVSDRGWDASVWTGSANATAAALQRNVEFLVELQGKRSLCGVGTVLRESAPREPSGLLDLLEKYEPGERNQADGETGRWEAAVDQVRRKLAHLDLTAVVAPSGPDTYSINLCCKPCKVDLPELVGEMHCRPITIGEGHEVRWPQIAPAKGVAARFESLTLKSLTAFFAFKVSDRAGEHPPIRFVLQLPLIDAPADRQEQILQQMLGDKNQVLRLLHLLLARDGVEAQHFLPDMDPATGGTRTPPTGAASGAASSLGLPLFENLVRALHEDPARLDAVGRLIDDLSKNPQTREMLPEGLTALWEPIEQVQARLRSQARGASQPPTIRPARKN
jgi:hypothetical protein